MANISGAPGVVRETVRDFFVKCVAQGETDVFDDLRDWGLTGAVLSLMFHDPAEADAALMAALLKRDPQCLQQMPEDVRYILDNARVACKTDLDTKLVSVVNCAMRRNTADDTTVAEAFHRAIMHVLVGFMGARLTCDDVAAAGVALGILPPPAREIRATAPQAKKSNPWARAYARQRTGTNNTAEVKCTTGAKCMAEAQGPAGVGASAAPSTQSCAPGCEDAAHVDTAANLVRTDVAPNSAAAESHTRVRVYPSTHQEAPGKPQESDAGPTGPCKAEVPIDVKALAEKFVHAVLRSTLQQDWPQMRPQLLGMLPADARALYFCVTRTGTRTGTSYWEALFACDLVDARTVLDALRMFDGHGVPIFAPLENNVRITALADKRAKREGTFFLVVAWLRAAKAPAPFAAKAPAPFAAKAPAPFAAKAPAPSATKAPAPSATKAPVPSATKAPVPSATKATVPSAARASNVAFPLATTTVRTTTAVDSQYIKARHAVAGNANGACVVCGRTAFELQTQLQATSARTGDVLHNCGQCHRVTYCSRVCQKWHWTRVHKFECAPTQARKNASAV